MQPDPADTCWTVVRAASRGDAEARASFSRTYAATIRGFLAARWKGRLLAAETDDATQEVFVECLKPGGVLEAADSERGDFRGLLFGVTRNVARRFEERALAGRQLRPEDSAWLQNIASDDPGQATLFDCSWAQALMRLTKRKQRELEEAREGLQLWMFLDTLASAQHATGDTASAVATQKRALELMPEGADPGMAGRLAEYEAAAEGR